MSGPDLPYVNVDSPFGDNTLNVWETILAQFANSPILTRLLENMDAYLDQTANFTAFYNLVMNVDTAQGYGLDVWGRIVGVSRTLSVPQDQTYFGFQEAGDAEPFNQAPFFSGQDLTDNFTLTDTAYRVLIFAKALANICDGAIPAINQILLNLFPGRGNCYVADGLDMTMSYVFEFELTLVEQAIVAQSGALPKSTGVSVLVITPP